MFRILVTALILLLPIVAFAQSEEKSDVWDQLRFLEGTWKGQGDGFSGTSEATQTYEFILKGKYLQMQTKSVFAPQDKNPKGEIHEDLAIFSYDSGRKVFVLRAFYVEGFVNTYVLTETSKDGKTLTFETEAVEGGPPGTTAKLVFERTGDNELKQQFFVAFPGQELSCFTTNMLERK